MTKSAPLLTVAIPAYNVELYLDTCLESLNIDSDELEVIVVNDGSMDDTALIADKFAQEYKNIKVINKENGGHGSAINTALKNANGKYFKLLDGDDFFEPNSLLKLIDYLKKTNSDIVLSDYLEFYETTNEKKPIFNYKQLKPKKNYNLDEIGSSMKFKGNLLSTTTFKTSLYKNSPFLIDEKCYYVDMEYNFFIFQRAKLMSYIPEVVYAYRLERPGQSMLIKSLMKNYKDHEKVSLRLASELDLARKDLSAQKYDHLLNKIVAPLCRYQYQILIEYLKNRKLFLEFDKKLLHYPEIYHSPLISGRIINVHRFSQGLTLKGDPIFRKLGVIKNRFENR